MNDYLLPDLAKCQRFARPFLEAARAAGPLPLPGGPEWCQLDDNDPRKLAALLRSGLARVAEDAELPATLARQLADEDREAVRRLRQASHDLATALTWARKVAR